mmetsp:Transcript_22638/g.33597  ORF Transcript_22638/g.33597 Transcript_22638/m.33597 type:complete len:122 (-) Transcript_22638:259-624(-)
MGQLRLSQFIERSVLLTRYAAYCWSSSPLKFKTPWKRIKSDCLLYGEAASLDQDSKSKFRTSLSQPSVIFFIPSSCVEAARQGVALPPILCLLGKGIDQTMPTTFVSFHHVVNNGDPLSTH